MEKFKPKLFSVMKTYSGGQFVKDLISGIIVAIIALPLSIALALASGVTPNAGIYTAIIAGFLVAFLGGSRVQIAGPTAAFATIVAGIVAKDGTEGLMVATIMAGVFLIIMGLLRFGVLLKYIPYTITTGFTAGIAVTLFIGQINNFCYIVIPEGVENIETIDKVKNIVRYFEFKPQSLIIGAICLAILIIWPMIKGLNKIPASLIAVIASAVIVNVLDMDVKCIGDQVTSELPRLQNLKALLDFKILRSQFSNALTIAVLAGIESLLSAVVADSMINSRHRSNMELVAQGVANIGSACFGGIPATGAIARTAANIKNGGRTPVAGMVHSVTLLVILVAAMKWAALIPMPCIAAILFQVAYNMCGWRNFVKLCKTAPKSDILVLVTTFVLTVVFDLVVAIEVGIVMAALLFMKRMSDVTQVSGWKYVDDEDDPDSISLRTVPKDTLVYEFSGPLFFAAADKILQMELSEKHNFLILRMRSVNAIDSTAMNNFETLYETCKKMNIRLVFSHVNEQPMSIFEKSRFKAKVGEQYFCSHIDDALALVESLHKAEA